MILSRIVFLAVFITIVSAQTSPCVGNLPCQNGGVCSSVMSVNVCQCQPGFSGSVCQEVLPVKYCTFNPCYNGGTCILVGSRAECHCPDGWSGVTCNYQASATTPANPAPTSTSAPATTPVPVTTQAPSTPSCPPKTNWPCGQAELVFLLEYGRTDVGSAIDHEGDYFKHLINEFQIDAQHIRVGVVVYHDTVTEAIHLDDYENDPAGLKAAITRLNTQLNPSGEPDLAKALDFVRQNSFVGARPGVPKIIIPIVHQMSNGTHEDIINAGERLKNECGQIYVQGVRGADLYEDTLKQLASEPSSSHYYSYRDFRALEIGGYLYTLNCPTPAPTCPNLAAMPLWECGQAEVIFLMEYGRTDIGRTIDHEGDFFKNLIDEYKMDPQHVRVGVVVYHDTVRAVVNLDDYENDKSGLKDRITRLNTQLNPSDEPDLAKALDYIREQAFSGARPGVPKVVVSIVHQMPTGSHEAIIEAGERLKNDCIHHYVMSVNSPTLNEGTLHQIASTPNSQFYYNYRDFRYLEYGGWIYDVDCPSS